MEQELNKQLLTHIGPINSIQTGQTQTEENSVVDPAFRRVLALE